jgi:hypothetical protein
MKLYELTGAYAQLQAAAEDGEDVSAQLEQLGDALEHKGMKLAAVLRGLRVNVEAFRQEELRLAARRKALEANAERIRESIRASMLQAGIRQIKAGTWSITLSDGPERVVVTDLNAVPDEYQRVTVKREVDKPAVLAAYKQDGEIIPGTSVETGTTLRIR